MDPVTAAAAVRQASQIAAVLLRGLSALFGSNPIYPYRYFRLGSLIQRWDAAKLAGVSLADRDAPWSLGVTPLRVFPSSGASRVGEIQAVVAHRALLKISTLAPDLLAGQPPSKVRLDNLRRPYVDRRPGQQWDWIEMGRAEFLDRWTPKARAILGEDPLAYYRKLMSYQAAYSKAHLAFMAVRSDGNRKKIAEMLALLRGLNYDAKKPALQKAWKETPATRALKSATAAKNELNRWITARVFTQEKTIRNALWWGPPAPWALELAAQAYGQYGPAAVIQYASISPGVTRDLRILLKRISPAAIADPVLAPFLRWAS